MFDRVEYASAFNHYFPCGMETFHVILLRIKSYSSKIACNIEIKNCYDDVFMKVVSGCSKNSFGKDCDFICLKGLFNAPISCLSIAYLMRLFNFC